MLQNIYILNFNNYYNRKVKGQNYSTLNDYIDYVSYGPFSAVNFNPNDGIITSHTFNVPGITAYELSGDYLIVVDDDTNDVLSRWFIIQAKRELNGQYTFSLRRDVIVDCYEDVIKSTYYIERAYLKSTSNPLIYNSENFQTNQIKKSEYLLKDESNSAWVVAYIASDYDGSDNGVRKKITARTSNMNTDFTYSKSELENLVGTTLYGNIDDVILSFDSYWKYGNNASDHANVRIKSDGTYIQTSDVTNQNIIINTKDASAPSTIAAAFSNIPKDNYKNNFYDYITHTQITNNQTLINRLLTMSGKLIKNSDDNTYFSFTLERLPNTASISRKIPINSGFYNDLTNYLQGIPEITVVSDANKNYYIDGYPVVYQIKDIEVVTGESISMEIPLISERMPLLDAPYDMLCIPYNSVGFWETYTDPQKKSDPTATLNIAQSLAAALGGSGALYDIQLLPYCPCMEYFVHYDAPGYEYSIAFDKLTENVNYSYIKNSNNENISFALWARKSSFNTTIPYSYTLPTDIIEFKVANECDKYRIVSPNYAGAFEFSATKNAGLTGFEVNCTYKPIQPYIHINPIFGGLYGGDYNDSRGLICGGNFSLPFVNDAWETYQIQNKSYMEAFDRQIENMETTYNIKREQQFTTSIIQGITGTLTGIGMGATLGGITANPAWTGAGAAGGGLIGAAANIFGATKDLEYADALQNEAKSYSKDMFNFSLQNIQALPNTLSRTSAFDINNKLYPFLEYYSCTDEEKTALRNKLIYNGMTVMIIGKPEEYIISGNPKFLQGQLIRYNDGESSDYHLTAEIANEIHKGVYI